MLTFNVRNDDIVLIYRFFSAVMSDRRLFSIKDIHAMYLSRRDSSKRA